MKFQARLRWWLFALTMSVGVATANAQSARTPPVTPKPAAARVTRTKPPAVTLKWTGDFDGMVQRRIIRILTPFSRTHYFIDKGVQRGVAYDAGAKLETEINKTLKATPATKVHVMFLPTSRDDLLPALLDGRGDIIAANVTVTPERTKLVDFTVPTKTDVREIVVTGPGAPALETIADLGGQDVYVRDGSIQFESLTALNATLRQQGRPEVVIRTVPLSLEDEDVLEMVNAGLLKTAVVDDFIGTFWKQVLPNLALHANLRVREDGDIAWAVRKDSPKLLAILDPFVTANKQGTLFGNSILQKYLKNAKYVKNATAGEDLKKFESTVEIFKTFGGRYSLDYLLMMAQGYQESGLRQDAKSHVGAVGVMQVMPATGKELNVGNIEEIEPNIHAGVKYIRFMIDQQFAGEPVDDFNKALFAFAAYNCGPGRLRSLRREATTKGLDPNVWFNNVERIAGERVGRETVQYVSNIYKYYVAYSLMYDQMHGKSTTKPAIR
jgi:membrane-bound lytic murein transglycosylase MltF